jgi:hypothetical protein
LEKLLFELFLKIFSVLVYSHVRCGCIHEDTLLLSLLVDSNFQRMDEALVDGWMPGRIFQA